MSLYSTLQTGLAEAGVVAPATLVVLGSGMGECFGAEELVPLASFTTGVEGHSGRIALYRHHGRAVLVVFGRRHMYEGADGGEITSVVRTAARLGVRSAIFTNAAGGLDPLLQSGDVLLIEGMIGSLLGERAVWGAAGLMPQEGGARRHILALHRHREILDCAWSCGVPLRSGVYAGLNGPSYETRAEIRMLRRIGAQVVGMSTVIEAAAAAAEGMEVVALSLVTNTLTDTRSRPLGHDEVIDVGARSTARVRAAVEAALDALHQAVG